MHLLLLSLFAVILYLKPFPITKIIKYVNYAEYHACIFSLVLLLQTIIIKIFSNELPSILKEYLARTPESRDAVSQELLELFTKTGRNLAISPCFFTFLTSVTIL